MSFFRVGDLPANISGKTIRGFRIRGNKKWGDGIPPSIRLREGLTWVKAVEKTRPFDSKVSVADFQAMLGVDNEKISLHTLKEDAERKALADKTVGTIRTSDWEEIKHQTSDSDRKMLISEYSLNTVVARLGPESEVLDFNIVWALNNITDVEDRKLLLHSYIDWYLNEERPNLYSYSSSTYRFYRKVANLLINFAQKLHPGDLEEQINYLLLYAPEKLRDHTDEIAIHLIKDKPFEI